MRDELDGRMWVEHHDQFSEWVDGAIGTVGSALRLGASRASAFPRQLLSIGAAIGLTALTFGTMAA
jgi:hypothetical protein